MNKVNIKMIGFNSRFKILDARLTASVGYLRNLARFPFSYALFPSRLIRLGVVATEVEPEVATGGYNPPPGKGVGFGCGNPPPPRRRPDNSPHWLIMLVTVYLLARKIRVWSKLELPQLSPGQSVVSEPWQEREPVVQRTKEPKKGRGFGGTD